MYAPLLLATVLSMQAQHLPVHQAARPIVVGREAPRNVEEGSLSVFAYCDVKGQSTIMMTNAGPTAFVVEWTLTAIKPGYPTDTWSSVSTVGPGQFEGWMSPAPYLSLDVRYDVDGVPTANSIDVSCPAATTLESGLED
jgi:hypothetical protein